MSRAEIALQIGQSLQLENGARITAKAVEQPVRRISGVSRHEAIHAVIAVERGRTVQKVTRIPGPGYEGLTELDQYDGAAAMGPHVANEEGTGYDIHIAELHGDKHSGAAVASSIIATHAEEIDAVAEGIEQHATLGHTSVVAYMELGRRRRMGIGSVVVEIQQADGKKVEKKRETIQGKVMIPGNWEELG